MALFFFVIEPVPREVLVGELAGWQRAALPGAGALGGMLVPRYLRINPTSRRSQLGRADGDRLSHSSGCCRCSATRAAQPEVFLLALVVDDLGAVLVTRCSAPPSWAARHCSSPCWCGLPRWLRATPGRTLVFAVLGR
jgi:NhaA family Na+:H+ antiporter